MLIDNNVTRLDGGMNTVPRGVADIFNSIKWPTHIPLAHQFEEDFYTFVAGQWTLTNVVGTGTFARADGNGGLALLTTDVNDDDQSQVQRIGAGITGESWLFDPNKKFFVDMLVTLSSAIAVDAFLGFCITDTTIIGGATDSLSFRIAEGSGNVFINAEKNSAEVQSVDPIGAVVAATQARLSMFYDGGGVTDGRLYGAVNGNIGSYIVPGASFPDDEALTLSFALAARSAGAKVLTLDRVWTAQGL